MTDDEIYKYFPEHMMDSMRNAPQRPEERIPEILALLQDIWMESPDQRFWQLLHNLKWGTGYQQDTDMYNVEDTRTIELLQWYLKRLQERRTSNDPTDHQR